MSCKSCGSTTAIFERLSGHFKSIPVLLPIELGHITMKDFSVSKIDQHFTISHDQRTLQYNLAGFTICTSKHFYSILNNNGQLIKYDGLRNPLLNHGTTTPSLDQSIPYSTSCTSLTNSLRFIT